MSVTHRLYEHKCGWMVNTRTHARGVYWAHTVAHELRPQCTVHSTLSIFINNLFYYWKLYLHQSQAAREPRMLNNRPSALNSVHEYGTGQCNAHITHTYLSIRRLNYDVDDVGLQHAAFRTGSRSRSCTAARSSFGWHTACGTQRATQSGWHNRWSGMSYICVCVFVMCARLKIPVMGWRTCQFY